MNLTTVTLAGALVAFVGVLATAVVAYVGKRGELSLTGHNSLIDQLQEELTSKKADLAEKRQELLDKTAALAQKDAAIAAEAAGRASTASENARLRAIIVQLGGDPG